MQSLVLLAGCLAAGKTTLAEAISTREDVVLAREDIGSLPLFDLWSQGVLQRVVLLQASFYCTTLATILRAAKSGKDIVVVDHSPAIHHHVYSKVLWKRQLLSDADWEVCTRLYDALAAELSERFRIRHLALPVEAETLRMRLEERRRDGGDVIPLALIRDYGDAFTEWVAVQDRALVLTQPEGLSFLAGDTSVISKVNAFMSA